MLIAIFHTLVITYCPWLFAVLRKEAPSSSLPPPSLSSLTSLCAPSPAYRGRAAALKQDATDCHSSPPPAAPRSWPSCVDGVAIGWIISALFCRFSLFVWLHFGVSDRNSAVMSRRSDTAPLCGKLAIAVRSPPFFSAINRVKKHHNGVASSSLHSFFINQQQLGSSSVS